MAEQTIETGVIHTRVPARLDRLPWSRFHWRVLIGLGTVWVLDGLEVTMVGSVAARLTEPDSGLNLTAGQVGLAGAIYIVGACAGALFFGHLTDRFGRKKLFMLTLGVYIVATVATAFSFSAWFFFLARFVTGAGIGGEYAAINSAIDELIPARVRGRVDLLINGTYWLGSAAGAAFALLFLSRAIFPADLGWRLAFGVGAVLGLTIFLVRRHVPESPRWLFIHGREEEAERIVGGIESDVEYETGESLDEPGETLTVRQRTTIPFRTIGHTAFTLYPKRAVLGLALFIGQAFIYNGITFNLGTLFTTFYGVAASFVPVFVIIYAVGNLLGPLTLGRLFDTVGRKPMIAGTYLGSAAATLPLAAVFLFHIGNEWLLIALIVVTFFLASAGASAAYLTVSEIFPMETRALAIAFFYAIGTGVGGIAGPLLFGQLIGSEQRGLVTLAFLIGAAVMAVGGITELLFGVQAEGASLESIAQPLTAEQGTDGGNGTQAGPDHRRTAQHCREEAERARARAAEHRAEVHEREAAGSADQARVARTLAEIDELRADELDEQAATHDQLAAARDGSGAGALERAQAAEQRARMLAERIAALAAEGDADARRHLARAAAAEERAMAREQRAFAAQLLAETDGPDRRVAAARAEVHEVWARLHEERAGTHEARGVGDDAGRARHEAAATELERRGAAAEERVQAAEHRAAADELAPDPGGAAGDGEAAAGEPADGEGDAADGDAAEGDAAEGDAADGDAADGGAAEGGAAEGGAGDERAARNREAAEREDRIRARLARREGRDGVRRLRLGPSPTLGAARIGGQPPSVRAEHEALDREVDVLARALAEHGPADRKELARIVGARYWGPGRFGSALGTAVEEGRVRRLTRRSYGPPDSSSS
ncbi:hypothetical protein GCM10017691_11090 [Pseudonocardia petroleophila]|uniref:MFS transporter n=1 Tax=Pseudonocardia petroleophila TaxID=37331 RepID=UPI00272CB0D2|nr:MFS transporter [Pseudonocardia petroleophila]